MPTSASDHQGFAGFDTAIGRCIAAWSGQGLLAVQLPQATEAMTRERLMRRCAAGRGKRAAGTGAAARSRI